MAANALIAVSGNLGAAFLISAMLVFSSITNGPVGPSLNTKAVFIVAPLP